jgi:hypothetical protein
LILHLHFFIFSSSLCPRSSISHIFVFIIIRSLVRALTISFFDNFLQTWDFKIGIIANVLLLLYN